MGRDSSVGIATGYWLDGPGIESRWGGEIFRTCPDRPWGPPSLLYNGYQVFPGGKERPGRYAGLSHPSGAVGHERVELYLYSAVRPVQNLSACTRVHFTLNVGVAKSTPANHPRIRCYIVGTIDSVVK